MPSTGPRKGAGDFNMVNYLKDLLIDKPKPRKVRKPKKLVKDPRKSGVYLGKHRRPYGPRTRVTWSPQPTKSSVTYIKPGQPILNYPNPTQYPTIEYERIHDVTSPWVANKPVGHVYHVKYKRRGSGLFNGGHTANTPGGYQGMGDSEVGLEPTYADVVLVPKLYQDATTYVNWGNECFTQFHTQVPVQLDLFNSIRELPDIVDLVRDFGDIAKRVNASLSALRRAGKLKAGLTLGDLASSKLAYEFGIKPILSDVQALVNMNQRVNDRLKFLQGSRLRPTKLNFTRKKETDTPFNLMLPGIPGNFQEIHHMAKSSTVMHAQATLVHNLQGLDSEVAFYRTLLGSTGLLHIPSTVWNAIPLSFVVDWVLRIGDKLDNHHVRPFEGKWELSNLQHSITEHANLETWHRWHPELGNQWRLAATWDFKRYVRFAGAPPTSPFTLNSLTADQQVLAGLLAYQRVR